MLKDGHLNLKNCPLLAVSGISRLAVIGQKRPAGPIDKLAPFPGHGWETWYLVFYFILTFEKILRNRSYSSPASTVGAASSLEANIL